MNDIPITYRLYSEVIYQFLFKKLIRKSFFYSSLLMLAQYSFWL